MRACAALLLAIAWSANAEVVCALGSNAALYKAASDQRPTSDALQLATRVNSALKSICADHCPTLALFRNPTAANIMVMAEHGDGKLVYSPQFLSMVYDGFGDDGIVALIAHEIGHALDATLGAKFIRDSWAPELRADAWAGCVLANINAGASGLQSSLAALQKYPPASATPWPARAPALRTGYTQCGGAAANFDRRK